MRFAKVVLASVSFLSAQVAMADIIAGEYLVKFKDAHEALLDRGEELGGAEIKMVIPERNIALVKPQSANIPNGDVLDKLRSRKDVLFVQPNYSYRTTLYLPRVKQNVPMRLLEDPATPATKPELEPVPSQSRGPDPMLDQDSDLKLANVAPAWSATQGNKNVVVAVIDTGVDYNHEDLAANVWHSPSDPNTVGWDFVDDDNKPYDVTAAINFATGGGNPGHGTHCAGNVGAVGGNALGTSGVAKNVSIMAMRMLNEQGQGESISGIKSIDWAVEHGARIISASWGSEGANQGDELLKEAIKRAEAKNVLFVAAAGNTQADEQADADNDNNAKRRTFPASFDLPNIISVAASDQNGQMAGFTHFGAKSVHLAAPGERSFSTVPGGRDPSAYIGQTLYEDTIDLDVIGKVPWNGTSMATPQVAGAAALLLSRHPKWNYAKIKKRLMDTVRPEPTLQGKTVTGGVLDVGRAFAD